MTCWTPCATTDGSCSNPRPNEPSRVHFHRVLHHRGLVADIIVLLTHQYMNDDTKLAPALPGVDIIFGGHDHARLHDVFFARGSDTIIQRSGAYGDTFGELTVVWDDEQIVDPAWRIVVVTDELPVSDAVEEIRQEYLSKAQ